MIASPTEHNTNKNVLVFDTETTGLPKSRYGKINDSSNWPYVMQLSFIVYETETNRVLKEGDYIIDIPETVDISPESIAIHGITRIKCNRDGIKMKQAIMEFKKWLNIADVVVAHNMEFDKKMLMVECARNKIMHEFYNNKAYYCTMKNSVNLCKIEAISKKNGEKYFKYPTLVELHKFLFNETPKNLHDSFIDILICFRCFYQLRFNEDIRSKNRRIGSLLVKRCSL